MTDTTLVIEFVRMAHGADAVGHLDTGKVVLARGAAPGDRARIRILREHRSYVEAELVEIVAPGPGRREAPCAHITSDECGGCPWQHLTESVQQKEKQALVAREVQRIDPDASVREIRTDIPPFGYRRRTRFGHNGRRLGYRQRGVQKIFDLVSCPVLDPRIDRELDGIRSAVAARPSGNIDVMVDAAGDVHVGGPAATFLQPSAVAETILSELVLEAIPSSAKTVVELFAGAGTFTRPLVQRGHDVRAWEVDRRSVQALRKRLPAIRVERLDLLRPKQKIDLGRADAVLLDPPRKGAFACIESIVDTKADTICYVSCDPMTLCRDLDALGAAGYQIQWVQPVDAFPQTQHVECVVSLQRSALQEH